MNIAVFASAFYPSLGGVEEVVRQEAHALRSQGHRVIVLTNRWPRDIAAHEEHEGIPVFRVPMRAPGQDLKSRASFRLTSQAVRREMMEILQRERPDILHIHCAGPNAHYALQAHRTLHLPLITTLHGELTMDADQSYQRSEWMRQMLRDVLDASTAISACSGQTLREAEAFYGQTFGARGRVIYSGIRVHDFDKSEAWPHPRPYMLAMGRHVAQKGFDILLRALSEWAKDEPNAPDLILAGDGPERASLESLADELGLRQRVHFVGRVERDDVVRLFQGCAFFVLPSRHEPMGIVNLEAMAAGKAVVAARVGGVAEIVLDNQTGVLFEGEDEAALTQAMRRVWCDEALRARLSQAGHERAQGFDWSRIAAQYLKVYETATAVQASQTATP